MNIYEALRIAEDFRKFSEDKGQKKYIIQYSLKDLQAAQAKLLGSKKNTELYKANGQWYKAMAERIERLSSQQARREADQQAKQHLFWRQISQPFDILAFKNLPLNDKHLYARQLFIFI